jgi:hypothetical protein
MAAGDDEAAQSRLDVDEGSLQWLSSGRKDTYIWGRWTSTKL